MSQEDQERRGTASSITAPRRKVLNRNRSHFTLKRGAHRHEENLFLSIQFAEWFTQATSHEVGSEEAFCASLKDGVVLCRLVEQIDNSGMKKFHDPPKNEFKKRENLVKFQESCKALNLPFVCRVDHIVKDKLDPVISCLLGLARVAAQQECFTLPEPIMEKIEAMEALEAANVVDADEAKVLSYAEANKLTFLDINIDGWVQRTPTSWLQGSWMDFGIRVSEVSISANSAAEAQERERTSSDDDEAEVEETGAWDVYRRYSEFETFASELGALVPSISADLLPGKTYSLHLTGDFLEGGTPALQERMDGLNAFLQHVAGKQSNADEKGYNAAIRRASASSDEPSKEDLAVIACVQKFLGI